MAYARKKSHTRKKKIAVDGNLAVKTESVSISSAKKKSRKKKKPMRFLQMSGHYAAFLSIVAICTAIIAIVDVSLYIRVHKKRSVIEDKRYQIESLQEDNAVLNEKLNNAVPLETIKKKAKDEYGMVNVRKDQVIKYRNEADDYMKVYSTTSKKNKALSSERR